MLGRRGQTRCLAMNDEGKLPRHLFYCKKNTRISSIVVMAENKEKGRRLFLVSLHCSLICTLVHSPQTLDVKVE